MGLESPNTACVRDEAVEWQSVECADGYNVHLNGDYFATVGPDRRSYPLLPGNTSPDNEWSVNAFMRDPERIRRPFQSPRTIAERKGFLPSVDKLIWSEDFATLDARYWSSEFDWGRSVTINNESQYYVAQLEADEALFALDSPPLTNAGSDGLRITARREPGLPNGLTFSSGKLCTTDARQLEGEFYVAVTARCDFAKGAWPAIWLYTATYGERQSEIDIMEQPGIDRYTAYHNYHYVNGSGREANEATTTIDTNDWHTYAVLRRAGEIVYFIDGLPVHRVTRNVILEPMNLIVNLAIGGNFAGEPPEELTEANFYVRSVSVYGV